MTSFSLQTAEYKERLSLLNDMDERLKTLDEFNGQLKAFDGQVKELEDWLPEGRKRMDDLLNPDNPVSAEDRVVQTMELQVSVLFHCQEQQKGHKSKTSFHE